MKINEYGHLETNIAAIHVNNCIKTNEDISFVLEKKVYPKDEFHHEDDTRLILKLRHKEIRKIIVFKCNKHFNFLPAEKTRMETCVKEFISIIHNLKKYNALLWYLGKSDKEYKRIKELYNY